MFLFNVLSPIYYVKRLEKLLKTNTFDCDIVWSNFFLEAFASCKAFSKKIPVIYIKHAIASNMIKLHASRSNDKISLNIYLTSIKIPLADT